MQECRGAPGAIPGTEQRLLGALTLILSVTSLSRRASLLFNPLPVAVEWLDTSWGVKLSVSSSTTDRIPRLESPELGFLW